MGKVTFTATALALISVLLLGVSFVEFSQLKAVLDARAPDGDADQFTRELHAAVVILLRVYAMVGLCLAALAAFYRHRLAQISPASVWTSSSSAVRGFWRETSRLEAAGFLFILLLGIWLRLFGLDQPIRSDEAWTYLNYVSRDILHVITDYSSPNNHILHNVLAHLSIALLGDTLEILRLPSFLAGVLALPVGYWLFYRLSGRYQALVALALLACWPMLVDYSTNARGYSMVVLLTLALFAAVNEIRLTGRSLSYVGFAVFAALGLYTVPSFMLSILTAGFWIVLLALMGKVSSTPVRFWIRLTATAAGSVALTALLYAPVIAAVGFEALSSNDVVNGTGIGFSQLASNVAAIAADWTQDVPNWMLLGLLAGLSALLWERNPYLLLFGAGLLCALLMVITIQGTMGPGRVWIFALPLFLGMASWGLVRLIPLPLRTQGSVAIALLVPVTILILQLSSSALGHYHEFGRFPEARYITNYLTRKISTGDLLITMFPANHPISYYDLRENGSATFKKHKRQTQTNARSRTFVVLPAGTSLEEALSWNEAVYGANYTQRTYKLLSEQKFGDAAVVVLRFDQSEKLL